MPWRHSCRREMLRSSFLASQHLSEVKNIVDKKADGTSTMKLAWWLQEYVPFKDATRVERVSCQVRTRCTVSPICGFSWHLVRQGFARRTLSLSLSLFSMYVYIFFFFYFSLLYNSLFLSLSLLPFIKHALPKVDVSIVVMSLVSRLCKVELMSAANDKGHCWR